MIVTIAAKGLALSALLRRHVARRLGFALDRHQHALRRAIVRLQDLNGPRGGVDKACTIELQRGGAAPLFVRAVAADAQGAVDAAARRAAHALARQHASRRSAGRRLR